MYSAPYLWSCGWRTVVLGILVLVSGCASRYSVDVDAMAAPGLPLSGQCVILPLDPSVTPDDLTFCEYARQIGQALQTRGVSVLPLQPGMEQGMEHNTPDVDCVVLLALTVSGPYTEVTIRPSPLWMGRPDRAFRNRSDRAFRGRSIARHLDRAPEQDVYSVTYYAATLELVAREVLGYRAGPASPGDMGIQSPPVFTLGRQLWKLSAILTAPDNDPRRMFPLVLAAARPYIGQDTGGMLRVTVTRSEDGLLTTQ